MTKDDIIRMAREVGFVAYGEDAGEYRIPTPAFHGRLERFFQAAYAAGAAAEREACAKVCDENAKYCNHPFHREAIQSQAFAIRARGNT